jgi:hypothetical protein
MIARRVTLLAAAILLAALAPSRADGPPDPGPLGESPAEIAVRYGPVRRHNARVRHHEVLEGGSALDGDLYEKNGILIRVEFHENQAVLLEYTKGVGPLTLDDVNSLLTVTAGGFSWETGKDSTETNHLYRRSDNRAVAHWSTEYDGSLLIASEDASSWGRGILP